MIFQSLEYLIFLALLFGVYWTLGRRTQNALLLVASYVFYGWVHPWFLLLIFSSTLVDYFCARGMARHAAARGRFLVASVLFNLGMLGTFKYFV